MSDLIQRRRMLERSVELAWHALSNYQSGVSAQGECDQPPQALRLQVIERIDRLLESIDEKIMILADLDKGDGK